MDNKYYIYEWIRLDTNEPFYVGKGKGRRWNTLTRGNNKHFNNIVKKIPVAVNFLEENLNEEDAYRLESWYIHEYRDVIGYDLVNLTDGGDGVTLMGESNPMYGRTWWDENTPKEKIDKWKMSVRNFGENNGNYKRKYTDEQIQKMRDAKKGMYFGKDNPNYGNDTLKKKYAANPELAKELLSRPGSQNGRAKPLYIYDLNGNLIEEFGYQTAGAEWLIKNGYVNVTVKTVINNINKSIKMNKPYLKFKFYNEKYKH